MSYKDTYHERIADSEALCIAAANTEGMNRIERKLLKQYIRATDDLSTLYNKRREQTKKRYQLKQQLDVGTITETKYRNEDTKAANRESVFDQQIKMKSETIVHLEAMKALQDIAERTRKVEMIKRKREEEEKYKIEEEELRDAMTRLPSENNHQMATNTAKATKKDSNTRLFSTRTLAYMAMLAALNVVLARFIGLMPSADSRFSIEAVPVILSGLFFGPIAGAITGFVGDAVGCLFSGYGYNPMFAVAPILYGLLPGLLRFMIKDEAKPKLWKIIVIVMVPVVFGSVLWQSFPMALYYGANSGKGYLAYASARALQYAVTGPLEILVVWLLFKSGIFEQMKVWQPDIKNI